MTIQKEKFRELVFQILYSFHFSEDEEKGIIKLLMMQLKISKKNVMDARKKAFAIFQKRDEMDQKVKEHCQSYEFSRIGSVEKNILRLSLYELLHDDEIPPKVAIAESIRLCRKFSTPESAKFVNAILDIFYEKAHISDE